MKKKLFSPLSDLEYKLYEHVWEAWKAFFKEHAPEKKDEKAARRLAMERFVKAVCASQNGEAGQHAALILPPVGSVVHLTLHLEDITFIVPELLEALYAPEFAIEHETALACFITLRQQPESIEASMNAAPAQLKKMRTVSYCSSSCKSSCRRKCGSYAKRVKRSQKRLKGT